MESVEIPKSLGISSYPQLKLFVGGKLANPIKFKGHRSAEYFEEFLED